MTQFIPYLFVICTIEFCMCMLAQDKVLNYQLKAFSINA